MKSQIFYNGAPLGQENIGLLGMDHALLYGDSICETIVAIYGKPLLLPEHLERLNQSAEMIGIKQDLPIDAISNCLFEGLKLASTPKTFIRVTISAGSGFGTERCLAPNWIMHITAAPTLSAEIYQKGLKLEPKMNPVNRRGAQPKTTNYQASLIAKSQALAHDFHDVLWTNAEREFTETSMANIFFLERDNELLRLITPALKCGLLAGTTRKLIIKLCRSAKIIVEERAVLEEELPRFDEAFLTSSVSGLIPVAQIGSHRLHTKRPRAHFPLIESLFLTWVHQQIGFPIHWQTGARLIETQSRKDLQ